MSRTVLEFNLRRAYSKDRYYPVNLQAKALVGLSGRKCLKDVEIERLRWSGFEIVIKESESCDK